MVVTARKLDAARDTIQPQLGASTYKLTAQAIQTMPGGDNSQLNQVVLQAPGVAQDSFGQLHIRGEHNGLQFRLNGVILPEGLSVFSQALSPRLADKVELITGALPAQYGLRTAGIIDITTKTGEYDNGGEISIYGGSHGEIEPSLEAHGHSGNLNYFASLSYLSDDLGVESPDGRSDPIHDHTDQLQGFAYLEDVIDDSSRVSLILGTSDQRFQIPDVSGELNGGLTYGRPAAQRQRPDHLSQRPAERAAARDHPVRGGQLSAHRRQADHPAFDLRSLLHPDLHPRRARRPALRRYRPGRAQDRHRRRAAGRGGLSPERRPPPARRRDRRGRPHHQRHHLGRDAAGRRPAAAQIGDSPVAIVDNGARTAETYSAYLQDEWKLADRLTLNYGLRFDQFDGFRDENQLSPRVNLVWKATGSTTVHLGYSRYFSPPPFELVASESVGRFVAPTGNPAVTSTAAPPVTADTTPYAERANYFDVGVSQKISSALSIGIDSYYKLSTDLIDEGQFGAPIILTPFNYARGVQSGVELTASYDKGPFSAYANLSYEKAQGEDIVSSQFNFDPADLAYIKTHYIYLDHDQTFSASAGASYLWRGVRVGGDLIYGSGLRADGAVPNGRELPGYAQVNLSLSHRFGNVPTGPLEVRLDVINLFDAVYEIRDGTGVGVGAPQYGPRRGFAGRHEGVLRLGAGFDRRQRQRPSIPDTAGPRRRCHPARH